MLAPRIYRNGLILVALAVIVAAFSLGSEPAPLTSNLVPNAFNGGAAYRMMQSLAARYPDRGPGSPGDDRLAGYVARAFRVDGLTVSQSSFRAQTIDGPRTLRLVTGTLAGLSGSSVVIVAHRDSLSAPGTADLSGTALLLELAGVLSAQTQQRPIVLASTSGSIGAAGAAELARRLSGSVDAVIVLGNVAATSVRAPIVVPWSNSQAVAPPLLRSTVAAALNQQSGLSGGAEGLLGQFGHLAFPMAVTEQAPFGALGEPAVLLSAAGERAVSPGERTSPRQITDFGRAVLQAIGELDTGPAMPSPSAYLLFDGDTIPAWAVSLLVLALVLPALAATIDALARAQRRGFAIWPWVVWVLCTAVPLMLAVLFVFVLDAVGALPAVPPGPLDGGAVTLTGREIGILVGLACMVVLAAGALHLRFGRWVRARPEIVRKSRRRAPGLDQRPEPACGEVDAGAASPGSAAAVLLLLCVVSLAIWFANPFAAAPVAVGLNVWVWILSADVRRRVPLALALTLGGAVPAALAVVYWARSLGLGPVRAAWNMVLMLAGGTVGVWPALESTVVLAAVVSLLLIAVRIARAPRREELPVSIQGPVGYVATGSLGRPGQALRR